MRLCLLLLAVLAVSVGPARAQDAPPDTLGAVTVTASRLALGTHEAPVHAVVVGQDAMGDAGARTVADALSVRTPVVVRRYGPGGLASVSVRGAGAAQTLVLLDGQPLADPQLGQTDLSLLPSALLESVEVVGGAASGLYGSGALGGVVGLRTDGSAGVRAAAEAGAWGERRVSGRAGGGRGVFSGVVAAEAARSEGDYAVPDPTLIGSPRVRREGYDTRQTSAYAAARAEGRVGRAAFSLWATDAERGLGGTSASGALVGARQWDRLVRLGATAGRTLRWGRVDASGAITHGRLRYASPFPATRPGALDETGQTRTLAADVQTTADRLVTGWTVVGLVAASEGRAEHPSLREGARDRSVGAGASAVGRVGRVALFPALRADLYAPAGGPRRLAASPQLGVAVSVTDALRLRASTGRAFRMPTLNDRFWTPGGNPALRPEAGWTADVGAAWAHGALHAEATLFWTRTRDQIVWLPVTADVFSPENVARTQARGLDVTAGGARLLGPVLLDGGAAVSLLDARDRTSGFRLRYSPAWTTKLWGGLASGPFRLDLNARAVGARPTTASGSQPLPAHVVLDGQVRWARRLRAGTVGLGIALDNLLDANYEAVRSYPMPPRNVRLRLTLDTR